MESGCGPAVGVESEAQALPAGAAADWSLCQAALGNLHRPAAGPQWPQLTVHLPQEGVCHHSGSAALAPQSHHAVNGAHAESNTQPQMDAMMKKYNRSRIKKRVRVLDYLGQRSKNVKPRKPGARRESSWKSKTVSFYWSIFLLADNVNVPHVLYYIISYCMIWYDIVLFSIFNKLTF